MLRNLLVCGVFAVFAWACSSSRSVYVISDYHFEFAGGATASVRPGPRVESSGVVYEVAEGRLLVDGVDYGPLRRRERVVISSTGEIRIEGVTRTAAKR